MGALVGDAGFAFDEVMVGKVARPVRKLPGLWKGRSGRPGGSAYWRYWVRFRRGGGGESPSASAEAARTVEVKKRASWWKRLLEMLGSVSAR